MNTDHTDKMGIVNKMSNLCLPRPPRESGGSVQIRVPKKFKTDPIHYLNNKWFDHLDKLGIFNRLTTLSQVEGQYSNYRFR